MEKKIVKIGYFCSLFLAKIPAQIPHNAGEILRAKTQSLMGYTNKSRLPIGMRNKIVPPEQP